MKAFKKLFLGGIILLLLSPFFFSCGSGEKEAQEGTDSTAAAPQKSKDVTTKNIFYAIPSPIELAQLIQRAGAAYNKDLLNPIENRDKYNTNTAKALNMGVYGADLSYTSVFDNNTQESILYLNCTQKLAQTLGVGSAFNSQMVDRIQANSGKKDSLLTIISDSYMSTDEMLKENQRESSSALVITGGFIEGIFLGTQLAKTIKNNADIISRIAEQKGTMDNVVKLLSTYEKEAAVAPVLTEVKTLQAIYGQVTVNSTSAPKVNTNPTTKVTSIGGKISYTIAPEILEKLTSKASELRTKIISAQI